MQLPRPTTVENLVTGVSQMADALERLLNGNLTGANILDGSIVDADIGAAAAIKGSKLLWSVGTSPPTSPSDGDMWIYSGTGLYWMFVYDSSETTYKWKFVGGPSLYAANTGGGTVTANSNWVAAPGSMVLTLPRAGDYEFEWNARGIANAASGVTLLGTGIAVGTTTPFVLVSGHSVASSDHVPLSGVGVTSGRAANDTLNMRVFSNTNSTTTHDNLELKVRPIRVS